MVPGAMSFPGVGYRGEGYPEDMISEGKVSGGWC